MSLHASRRGRLRAAAPFGLPFRGARRVDRCESVGRRRHDAGARASRHDRDGDAARARRAHAHDFDERLRVCVAGRHHRIRGRRLSCRRRVRRRRRSRAERATARRVVDGVARGRGRDEAGHARSSAKPSSRTRRRRSSAANRSPTMNLLSKADLDRLLVGAAGVAARGSSPRAPISRRRSSGSSSRTSWRPTTASSPRARSPSGRSRRPATRCCACCATAASSGAARRPRRGSRTWLRGRASASSRPTARRSTARFASSRRRSRPTIARRSFTSTCRPTSGCVPACTRAARSRSARAPLTWCRSRAS